MAIAGDGHLKEQSFFVVEMVGVLLYTKFHIYYKNSQRRKIYFKNIHSKRIPLDN